MKTAVNRKISKAVALLIAMASIAGCATRETVESEGIQHTFVSKSKPSQLAQCIVRRIDGTILGALKAHIESDSEDKEVIVRNGENIWSLVKIKPDKEGSRANIYYGGAAKIDKSDAFQRLTEGCE